MRAEVRYTSASYDRTDSAEGDAASCSSKSDEIQEVIQTSATYEATGQFHCQGISVGFESVFTHAIHATKRPGNDASDGSDVHDAALTLDDQIGERLGHAVRAQRPQPTRWPVVNGGRKA